MASGIAVHFNGIDPLGRKIQPSCHLDRDRPPVRRPARGRSGRLPIGSAPTEQDLAKAGWGAIFRGGPTRGLRQALAPLLALRSGQAGARYRDDLVWTARETPGRWIERQKKRGLPGYLLIVGDAGSIPFELQFQLQREHAVGRVSYATHAEYRAFASALVAQERARRPRGRRRLTVFAPRIPNDAATKTIADELAVPLARWARPRNGQSLIGRAATKAALGEVLRRPPSVLLTTSHGMARLEDYYYLPDAALRRVAETMMPWSTAAAHAENGALICQDWKGYEPGGVIPRTVPSPADWFAARDLPASVRLHGLVAVLVACFSGGTPRLATYVPPGRRPPRIADRAFVARLPLELLLRGALGVVGHVEQASAVAGLRVPAEVSRLRVMRRFVARVLEGERVGTALGALRARASYLDGLRATLAAPGRRRPTASGRRRRTAVEFAFDDAQGFILIGDPAARMPRSS